MIDEIIVENAVRQWCADVTGIQFIISSQTASGYRLDDPYGTIQLEDFEWTQLLTRDYVNNLIDTIDERVNIRPTVTVDINIFGDTGKTQMMALIASVWQSETIEFFQENELGFMEFTPVRALPRLTHTDWEKRVQVDCKFGLTGTYVSEIDPIETVEIDNEINNTVIIIP